MRVVHVTNSQGNFIFGVERHILYLAAAQKARGMSVSVVVDRPGAMAEACQKQGIPVAIVESLKLRLADRPDEKTVQDLIEQFKSFDAELMNCHVVPAGVHAIPAANEIGLPCVFTLHFNGDIPPRSPLLEARRTGLRFAIMCVSKPRFEDMKKLGIPEKDLYYSEYGTDAVSPAHSPDASQSSRPNLIFVGDLSHRKGVDIAILAMSELRRRHAGDHTVLNIYGDSYGEPPGEQYLEEMVAAIDLKDIVLFHGHVHDILASCNSTDILVLPSRGEQGPQVVLEAMSRGIPAVISDVGDVRVMIPDRRYGRIVPVNSIIKFADAVEAILADIADGQIDPDLLRQRHQELFTSEKMAERIEAVYKSVLNDFYTG